MTEECFYQKIIFFTTCGRGSLDIVFAKSPCSHCGEGGCNYYVTTTILKHHEVGQEYSQERVIECIFLSKKYDKTFLKGYFSYRIIHTTHPPTHHYKLST